VLIELEWATPPPGGMSSDWEAKGSTSSSTPGGGKVPGPERHKRGGSGGANSIPAKIYGRNKLGPAFTVVRRDRRDEDMKKGLGARWLAPDASGRMGPTK